MVQGGLQYTRPRLQCLSHDRKLAQKGQSFLKTRFPDQVNQMLQALQDDATKWHHLHTQIRKL